MSLHFVLLLRALVVSSSSSLSLLSGECDEGDYVDGYLSKAGESLCHLSGSSNCEMLSVFPFEVGGGDLIVFFLVFEGGQ